jgi:hypothetical protein
VSRLQTAALALPFILFLGIYGPSVGHGFVADDFAWILDSRVASFREIPSLFQKSSGFYRPIVGLSFAADYAVFGSQPLGYGLTNVAFAGICAVLLYLVARALTLPPGAALLACALWLLNPHGINTSVLWMSGRTSLLLTMGSLAATLTLLRGRPFLALLPAAFALFSKEEAFLLPLILYLWWSSFRPGRLPSRRQVALWWLCAAALIGVYLALRSQTGAMTPWTAPPYYRFTVRPSVVGRNILEYADRAMTFPAAVAVLTLLLLQVRSREPWFSRSVALCGAAWIVGGYGLTMFLPVRSSLYACFPSVGACLIAADGAARRWPLATAAAHRRVAIAGITAVIALTPVYLLRNRTTVANAKFSSVVLHDLAQATSAVPEGTTVVVVDDRARRPNIETAFNMALSEAFELTSGRRLNFWVEPPLQHAALAGLSSPCQSCPRYTLAVVGGHVVK